ncbi:hypothetical protein BGZ70_001897 [Mortierella alpina]|uniref:LsmAD domain-containing protein n=1 Tax=Mortierella alpina TaxID=64518 RepID=A0A9P6IVF1_MORAP|nr:hypothetical protein BGZ70_001897 [Mortierella alpina]
MIGMTVEITVKNGSKYEGLFHTAFTEGDLGIVLRLAKPISGRDKKEHSPLINQMIVLAKDCMAINVVGVDFEPHERMAPERGEREGFKTDTDISRSGDIRERDLKKWAPEEHTGFGGIEDDLTESHHGSSTAWDQFAANERLFGVRTDFDEELYTTKLDRTGVDFKAREQHAIQIANEIQQSVSSNVHMREERGLAVDDSGLDEEDLYGAVVRDPLPASNKYMPPAMRRQQELNQQKRPGTPSNQHPTPRVTHTQVLTSPSASALKPQQAPLQTQHSQASTIEAKDPTLAATSIAPVTAAATTPAVTAGPSIFASTSIVTSCASKPLQSAEQTTIGRSNSTKGSSAQFNLNDLRTHNPVSALLNAATIQGSKNQHIPEHAVDAKQIEDNLAKFAMTARTFATNDKALVNQTKMGLTQRRTELFQMEKNGLAAELKQFGKEMSKKLNNTPMPDDVKEIFGKKGDHTVIAAGTTDISSKVATPVRSVDNDKIVKEPKDAAPTATKSPATAVTASTNLAENPSAEKSAPGNSFKFNPKASVFKPNVNAAPFTPSFATGGDKKSSAPGAQASAENLFFGRIIKKGPQPLQEFMSSPFAKGQASPSPTSITPTWPYGQRAFRHLFQVTNRYEEDLMYSQGLGQHGGNGTGSYYAMSPYSYGPSGQFNVPPHMAMGGPTHMVPFMGTGGPVPFSQPPPPPPGMPHTGAGPGFSQMAPTSSRGPMMMRYPPPDMMPPLGPNGMIVHQRPLGIEPQMMHYPASTREQASTEDAATDSPAS